MDLKQGGGREEGGREGEKEGEREGATLRPRTAEAKAWRWEQEHKVQGPQNQVREPSSLAASCKAPVIDLTGAARA